MKATLVATTWQVPGLKVPVKAWDIVRNWLVASALGLLAFIFQPSVQDPDPVFQLVCRLWLTNWAFWTAGWVLEASFWRPGRGMRILPLPKRLAKYAPAFKTAKVFVAAVMNFGLVSQIFWAAGMDGRLLAVGLSAGYLLFRMAEEEVRSSSAGRVRVESRMRKDFPAINFYQVGTVATKYKVLATPSMPVMFADDRDPGKLLVELLADGVAVPVFYVESQSGNPALVEILRGAGYRVAPGARNLKESTTVLVTVKVFASAKAQKPFAEHLVTLTIKPKAGRQGFPFRLELGTHGTHDLRALSGQAKCHV